jgi:Xaa-Pro aminopeptidase
MADIVSPEQKVLTGDPTEWSPAWSNAVFSLDERDRRWAKVRQLMARDRIDLIVCLPCTNSHDRGQADSRYLTQLGENSDETTVAFPIEGNVTAWHSRPGVWPSSNWFSDIRATNRGSGGLTIARWLQENPRYQTGTIAISGLDSDHLAHVRAAEGEVNWRSVELLKESFPKARFVSATRVLGEARWRKSAEEIDFLRKGTTVAEVTLEAMRRYAREGVSERHVFAQMMFANADAGGSFTPMFGWATGPLGHAYHRLEQPSFRKLGRGDVINIEIEGRWGGYIAQIDQTALIGGPAPSELIDGFKLSVESFNRVLAKMAPGVTMGELLEVFMVKGLGGRAVAGLGMHGRGTGDDGPLLVAGRANPPEVLNMVLEEGCSFSLKPSTILDGRPDYCKWGDSVVVTRTGAERLGTKPPELMVLT